MFLFEKKLCMKYRPVHEALSTDITDQNIDFDKADIDSGDPTFVNFVWFHIFKRSGEPLTDREKAVLEFVKKTDGHNKIYDKSVKVLSFEKLSFILKQAYKFFGDNGNYNWIDTSQCDDFNRLFTDPTFRNFNGDITRWDTSNVTKMMFTFQGCKGFTQDITGWDVSKVRFVNKDTYKNSNKTLETMFQQMKKAGKFISKAPTMKL